MKKSLLILALPVLCFAASTTFAADMAAPMAPKTRAEVKQETTGALASPTQKNPEMAAVDAVDKAGASTKTRADVKSETKAAAASGDLPKAGEAVGAEANKPQTAPKKKSKKMKRRMAKTDTAASTDTMAK